MAYFESDYELETKYMRMEFPNAKFTVSLKIKDLDKIVSCDPSIKISYRCCFQNTIYFKIINQGKYITLRDVIHSLVNSGFYIKCGHTFFEGLRKNPEDNTIEIITGS